MPRASSSIVTALDRTRDCSDVFARAMECGKSLAQASQRGKKTWESKQRPLISYDETNPDLRLETGTHREVSQVFQILKNKSPLLWCESDPHEWPPYSSIHWINHYRGKGLRTVPVNCLISCHCQRTCRQAGFNPIGWAGALMLKGGSMMSHQNVPTTVHPRKRIHYSREPDRVQAKAC